MQEQVILMHLNIELRKFRNDIFLIFSEDTFIYMLLYFFQINSLDLFFYISLHFLHIWIYHKSSRREKCEDALSTIYESLTKL